MRGCSTPERAGGGAGLVGVVLCAGRVKLELAKRRTA